MANTIKDLDDQVKDLEREIKRLSSEQDQLNRNSIEAGEKQLEIQEKLIQLRQTELTIARKKEKGEEEAIKNLEVVTQEYRSQLELLEKQKEVFSEVDELSRDFAGEISGLMGVMSDLNESGFGKMLSLIEKSGGTIKAINNAALKLSENLHKKIILSLAEKGQEMFLGFFEKLDEAGANLAKAIPQGRDYQKMVEKVTEGNQAAYFSFEQVSESVIDLNTNFTEFSRLGTPQQEKLVKLSTTLDKLGVSTETFAENLDLATKALGFSTDEFEDFQKEMFTFSKQLGVNMGTLNKRFKEVSGHLAKFEKTKVVKIFKEMNVVAKNLGIEFNKLFDITENFTTFEGAAEAAGSLNSVLGGNLINTIDLMNAALDNPIEVFKQFKGALDKTGKSFSDMTPAMKRTIAEMMKMDVSEVERLANMDLSQGIDEMQQAAASTEELEKAARDATPVLDKLAKLGYKFAVLISPAVDLVNKLVDAVMRITARFPEATKVIGGLTMGLGIAVAGILAVAKVVVALKALGIMGSGGGIVGALVGKGTSASAAPSLLTNIGTSASAGAKGFLSLGAAALMVGAGIAAAAYGMAQFVMAFQGMSPEQIQGVTIAIGVFTGGLVLMVLALSLVAKTAGKAGIELLPLGAAIGLIGAGIGLAAWGMSKLVEGFVSFMKEADLGKLAALYLGINGLAIAFGSLAASFVAIGIAAPALISFALNVRIALNDSVLDRLKQTAEYITVIASGLQNINAIQMNGELSINAARASTANSGGGTVYVQLPGETINLNLKGDIILDGSKVGDFVQQQIVKREDKLVPGSIQSSIGIKTGRYED